MKAEDYISRLDGISIENKYGESATIPDNTMLYCILVDILERLKKIEETK